MTANLKSLGAAASVIALFAAGAATAQQPAAQPAQPAVPALSRPGPNIAGVCIIDTDRVIATSAVGRAVSARLQALQQQIRAELQPQATAIETEARTLETQRATLQPAQFQQRGQALQQRANALQQLGELRGREMAATEQQALGRVGTELRPVIDQVYGQRNCGILVNRAAIVAANPAMDLTDSVIQGLNARIQTFNFERVRAPAAAPAAPAATPPAR